MNTYTELTHGTIGRGTQAAHVEGVVRASRRLGPYIRAHHNRFQHGFQLGKFGFSEIK